LGWAVDQDGNILDILAQRCRGQDVANGLHPLTETRS
jgi:hypothetical protein